jgi:hypothetical protein
MDEIHFDLTDLTVEKFFAWDDLKPGDHGEATISFHVYNNDAWGWLHFMDVHDNDNGLTEPEEEAGDVTGGDDEGELSQYIYTFMWLDEGMIPGWQGPRADEWEGNNEFDVRECDTGLTCSEPIIIGTPYQEEVTMYDMHALDCCWTGPWYIEGSNTVYIGWYWWIPDDVGNKIQSDSFEFGVEFYVEQYRNNPNPVPPGIPCGPIEKDVFENSEVQLELIIPDGSIELVRLSGPTTWHVMFEGQDEGDSQDNDGNGLEEIQTELVQMELVGLNPTLGPIKLRTNASKSSMGQIEEKMNNVSGKLDLPPFTVNGTADSFFDVFVEIDIDDKPLQPVEPVRIAGKIQHKPPKPGENIHDPGITILELFDADGNPTGYFIVGFQYTPNAATSI